MLALTFQCCTWEAVGIDKTDWRRRRRYRIKRSSAKQPISTVDLLYERQEADRILIMKFRRIQTFTSLLSTRLCSTAYTILAHRWHQLHILYWDSDCEPNAPHYVRYRGWSK